MDNDAKKCVECKEYYCYGGNYCTLCRIKVTQSVADYRKTYSFTMADVCDLFRRYKEEMSLRNVLLDNSHFAALQKLCQDKLPNEIYPLMLGYRDFTAVAMTADQATSLWHALQKRTAENAWRYAHAICPFVIDLWNFHEHPCSCYYLSETVDKPVVNKIITTQWTTHGYFKYSDQPARSVGQFNIGACTICQDITSSVCWLSMCNRCKAIFHTDCIGKAINNRIHHCPNCNAYLL